jgi:hypothetical protein
MAYTKDKFGNTFYVGFGSFLVNGATAATQYSDIVDISKLPINFSGLSTTWLMRKITEASTVSSATVTVSLQYSMDGTTWWDAAAFAAVNPTPVDSIPVLVAVTAAIKGQGKYMRLKIVQSAHDMATDTATIEYGINMIGSVNNI